MTEVTDRGILAFDIVHAVEFSRIGRARTPTVSGWIQGNCSNLPARARVSSDTRNLVGSSRWAPHSSSSGRACQHGSWRSFEGRCPA